MRSVCLCAHTRGHTIRAFYQGSLLVGNGPHSQCVWNIKALWSVKHSSDWEFLCKRLGG